MRPLCQCFGRGITCQIEKTWFLSDWHLDMFQIRSQILKGWYWSSPECVSEMWLWSPRWRRVRWRWRMGYYLLLLRHQSSFSSLSWLHCHKNHDQEIFPDELMTIIHHFWSQGRRGSICSSLAPSFQVSNHHFTFSVISSHILNIKVISITEYSESVFTQRIFLSVINISNTFFAAIWGNVYYQYSTPFPLSALCLNLI